MSFQFVKAAAIETGLSTTEISRIVRSAPRRYKVYPIAKRSGGERIIAQPSRELKDLQYFLMKRILFRFRVHDAATAYKKGSNIRINADRHVDKRVILKMDFSNFFESIRPGDFTMVCRDNHLELDEEDTYFCRQVLFRIPRGGGRMRLAIGAPTSPILSNAIMYRFDQVVSNRWPAERVSYTRYADDLTFGSDDMGELIQIRSEIPEILRRIEYPIVYLNHDKTALVTRGRRISVTGLVLANQGYVSIGRDRKRRIRATVHAYSQGELRVEAVESLRGELAFVNSVEPAFLDRLRNKFSNDIIDGIMHREFRFKRNFGR